MFHQLNLIFRDLQQVQLHLFHSKAFHRFSIKNINRCWALNPSKDGYVSRHIKKGVHVAVTENARKFTKGRKGSGECYNFIFQCCYFFKTLVGLLKTKLFETVVSVIQNISGLFSLLQYFYIIKFTLLKTFSKIMVFSLKNGL